MHHLLDEWRYLHDELPNQVACFHSIQMLSSPSMSSQAGKDTP